MEQPLSAIHDERERLVTTLVPYPIGRSNEYSFSTMVLESSLDLSTRVERNRSILPLLVNMVLDRSMMNSNFIPLATM